MPHLLNKVESQTGDGWGSGWSRPGQGGLRYLPQLSREARLFLWPVVVLLQLGSEMNTVALSGVDLEKQKKHWCCLSSLVPRRGARLLLEGRWGAWRQGWRGGQVPRALRRHRRRAATHWEGAGEGEGRVLNRDYLTAGGWENLQQVEVDHLQQSINLYISVDETHIVGRRLQRCGWWAGVAVTSLRDLVVSVPSVGVWARWHSRTEPEQGFVKFLNRYWKMDNGHSQFVFDQRDIIQSKWETKSYFCLNSSYISPLCCVNMDSWTLTHLHHYRNVFIWNMVDWHSLKGSLVWPTLFVAGSSIWI